MASYNDIKETMQNPDFCHVSIADVLDYLETCVSENNDINGDTTLPFDSLDDLIGTYLDGIELTDYQYNVIFLAACFTPALTSAVKIPTKTN